MNKFLIKIKKIAKEITPLGLIIVILILLTPLLFTQVSIISFKDTGPIGDTIGGITAPFVNLLAAYLVYRSFQTQVLSNNRQLKAMQYQKQQHDDQMAALSLSNSFDQINSLFTRFISNVEKDNVKHRFAQFTMFDSINYHIEYASHGNHDEVPSIEDKLICATYHLVVGKHLVKAIYKKMNLDPDNSMYFILELVTYMESLNYSKNKDKLSDMLNTPQSKKIEHRKYLQGYLDTLNAFRDLLTKV